MTPASGAVEVVAGAVVGAFVDATEHADVAVIVVTYNSGRDLARLVASLRGEAHDQRLRVVVVDNASTDDTLALARAIDDVIVVESGGNLGYAGGINVALGHVGDADAVLVLNPDLVVEPGCVARLRARMAESGAGVVVPRFLEDDQTFTSLRREPSVIRAAGDAVFGERFIHRSGMLSEWVLEPAAYAHPHEVEWSTGAALLIDARVARLVGDWDERFFLYSEETDFFRRVRELGRSIWYEPAAVVRHDRAGSGRSVDLDRLVTVNRVRYYRKHHGRTAAAAFRSITVLHQAVRAYSATYRPLLVSVIDESSWPSLPRARRVPSPERMARLRGTIVVDARRLGDGAASAAESDPVIARTLRALAPFEASADLQVTVGGADAPRGTAGAPVLVIEAGLEPDPATVVDTLCASADPDAFVVPPHEWTLEGAPIAVRVYAWAQPSALLASPPSPGMYCVGSARAGRESPSEPSTAPAVVETNPVRVPVPRSVRLLRRTLRGSTSSMRAPRPERAGT